jgi:hypothetical protein
MEAGYLPFVRGALQVELEVHFNTRRQDVVHDRQPDVLLVAVVAEHAEKLGQQGVRILEPAL